MNATSPSWKVDDFNSDLHRLSALMEVICQLQFDRRADEVVPHVDDLLWIAREMAAGLSAYHDGTSVRPIGGERNG